VVGGSIPSHEVVSLLNGKPCRWSSASCVEEEEEGGKTIYVQLRFVATFDLVHSTKKNYMTNISLMKISREPPHNIKPTDVLVLLPKIDVKLIWETKSTQSSCTVHLF
jgi:hypothetical protein